VDKKRRRTLKGKTVVVVDDEEKVLFLLSDALKEEEFKVKTTTLASEALEILKKEPIDAVLLDLVMPGLDGIEALPAIKKLKPHVPVIMLSGHGTIETAVKSLKLGAHDFLEKIVSTNRILVTLENAIRTSELEQDKRHLLKTVQEEHPMIGDSDAINKVLRMIGKMVPIDSPVLITGENGTGKELVARALHLPSVHTEETLTQAMNRTEKEIISTKLHALDWNYEQVMKELDISRATLFNKIKAHGISSKRKRQSQSPIV
jgi:two-component system nitrogen regulation response regulator NtrX